MRLWLLCILACTPVWAGIWDIDRPDDAALQDVIAILGGRFDRPAPDFYRARLNRTRPLIEALPSPPTEADLPRILEALPLYDDAAIALMRLGEFNDAIILLDRKTLCAQQVKALDTAQGRKHHIRALANKAACLHARFQRDGTRDDLALARTTLREVLEMDTYNADASFALEEVAWLLSPPAYKGNNGLPFPNLLDFGYRQVSVTRGPGALAQFGRAGAVQHLCRRIVHGGGWRDVDVLHALSLALWVEGRDEEAITAWLRVNELTASGATSRVVSAPANPAAAMAVHLGELTNTATQQSLFNDIRAAAETWVTERNAYATERIKQGQHPDTDPAFWNGFGAAPLPQPGVPGPEPEPPPVSTTFVIGGLAAFLVMLFVMGAMALHIGRRHPKAPTVDEV
ncbi:MAG: hypothetical protein IT464_10625 [Planctomycetes bacterium]|nr:hypothetical protein [Planctomycetota bacterium]